MEDAVIYSILTDTHFTPRPIVIVERFKFHKRNQAEGESVAQYVAVLKKLAEHCEFGYNLNDTLRDRLVCGLSSESIQKKLLTESTLTYKKAVDMAMSMEAVSRESQHLSNSLKVNAVSLSSESAKEKCFRCGKSNHIQNDSFYKDQLCHNCGKATLYGCANVKKQRRKYLDEEWDRGRKDQFTEWMLIWTRVMKRQICEKKEISETDSISSVIKVQPKIEGLPTEMEDDTCVEVSIISRELCQGFALTLFVLCFVSCVYVLCQHMVLLIVFLAMCSFSPSSSCPFYHTLLLAWLI